MKWAHDLRYSMISDDYCCVFRPAFRCCVHPKAGQNSLFCDFSLAVLSCAVICRTKVSPFGNLVPRNATTQKGLETCSLLSTCCQKSPYNTFFLDFRWRITKKHFNLTKKGWKRPKKYFDQLLGVPSTWKLIEKHKKLLWIIF